MSPPLKHLWILSLLCCALAVWPAAGPAVAQGEPGEKPVEEPAADAPDPYAVPEATPAELVQYIQRLMSRRPPDADARKKAIAAMLEAADKILSGQPEEAEARIAVRVKTMFLETPEALEAFADQLQKSAWPKLARQVGAALFSRRLGEAARGLSGDDAAARGQATEKIRELVNQIKQFLAEGPVQASDVSLAYNAGRAAEMTEDTKLAVDAYTGFAKQLAAGDDLAAARAAKTMEGIVRRLMLVGEKINVEGTLLGGEPLDWSKYQGKVVLVDFWATWCGPCVVEMPNVKKTYQLYHDLGFDIVGISLDRNRKQLEKFIQEKEIPWTIVYDDDGPSPTVEHYGVVAIPTMILVGKDGNVVSIRARGSKLREELEKLLGPVEEKNEEKDKEPQETSKQKG